MTPILVITRTASAMLCGAERVFRCARGPSIMMVCGCVVVVEGPVATLVGCVPCVVVVMVALVVVAVRVVDHSSRCVVIFSL